MGSIRAVPTTSPKTRFVCSRWVQVNYRRFAPSTATAVPVPPCGGDRSGHDILAARRFPPAARRVSRPSGLAHAKTGRNAIVADFNNLHSALARIVRNVNSGERVVCPKTDHGARLRPLHGARKTQRRNRAAMTTGVNNALCRRLIAMNWSHNLFL